MISAAQIAGRYVAFAIVATAANFATQMIVAGILGPSGSILPPLAAGTLVGLVVKFELDRRWIFHFVPKSAAHQGGTFLLYTGTGIATTAIFWGLEMLADKVIGGPAGRYIGGAVGLAIGYVVKYRLDKRFVFGGAAA